MPQKRIMFKTSDVTFNADQLFQLNYGYIVVEVLIIHLLCNHRFQKLKNPMVTEPLVYTNETQICFSMSSYGSVTYYENVLHEPRLVYYHTVEIPPFVL